MNIGLLLSLLVFADADAEIYRCLLEDGTMSFQETPCPEPAVHDDNGDESDPPANTDDAFDFVNPFDEPESPPRPIEAALPEPASQDRAECEKTTRDAIDAIDLEMRGNAYSEKQGEHYLADLLTLTRQLRACKQL